MATLKCPSCGKGTFDLSTQTIGGIVLDMISCQSCSAVVGCAGQNHPKNSDILRNIARIDTMCLNIAKKLGITNPTTP
jgi:hypothetical protein